MILYVYMYAYIICSEYVECNAEIKLQRHYILYGCISWNIMIILSPGYWNMLYLSSMISTKCNQ